MSSIPGRIAGPVLACGLLYKSWNAKTWPKYKAMNAVMPAYDLAFGPTSQLMQGSRLIPGMLNPVPCAWVNSRTAPPMDMTTTPTKFSASSNRAAAQPNRS